MTNKEKKPCIVVVESKMRQTTEIGRGLISLGPKSNGKSLKIFNYDAAGEQICVLKRILV